MTKKLPANQCFALRPGGTPQEISRGQARAAGTAPGWAAERAVPQRGIEEVFLRRTPHSSSATTRRLGPFSSMPRWGTEPPGTVSGGGVRWGRTCPRLISSGVPPGRELGVSARSAYAVQSSVEYFTAPLPPQPWRPGRSRSALVAVPRCVHRVAVVSRNLPCSEWLWLRSNQSASVTRRGRASSAFPEAPRRCLQAAVAPAIRTGVR